MVDKNLLRAELILQNITAKDLADILGISQSAISKKINGISEFSLSELQTISSKLGIEKTISIFFADKVSQKKQNA